MAEIMALGSIEATWEDFRAKTLDPVQDGIDHDVALSIFLCGAETVLGALLSGTSLHALRAEESRLLAALTERVNG